MTVTTGISRFAVRLATGLTRRHPYREAILGDLQEEFASIAHSVGERAARSWYRRELLRSAFPLLRAAGPDWLPFCVSLAAAASAYGAILATDAAAMFVLGLIAPESGRALTAFVAFGTILVTGIGVGRMIRRVARYRTVAALALVLVAGVVGLRHVWRSRHGEQLYRAAKVAAVMAAIGVGLAPTLPRRRGRQPQPR